MRVLVVDDEPDVLLLCRVNFEFAGHEVLETDNAEGLALGQLPGPVGLVHAPKPKKETPSRNRDGVSQLIPAASYSPTQFPAQYHRLRRA